MARAAGVGFSCIDVYEKLDRYYPTGNGVDFCIHLSRMGIETSIVSVVGDDPYGEMMREALQREGIDISHLHVRAGATCRMMMDLDGNDRVHLEEIEGVMADFALSEEDIRFIKTYDYLHTDLFGKILSWLPDFKAAGVRVVMDFSVFYEDPAYCASRHYPHVDYVFGSYPQRDAHIEGLMREIQRMGPDLVTMTLGENGSLCFDGTRFYQAGIVPAEVVNTVGAGDSYIAGFMYGVMQGWPVPDCMQKGAETAAQVVARFAPY